MGGRPSPPDGWEDDGHNAQPEVGDGDGAYGKGASDVVAGRILPYRRVYAHRKRDEQADDYSEEAELHANRHFTQDVVPYLRLAPQRLSEVSPQDDVPEPAHILNVGWHVQSQAPFEHLSRFLVSLPVDAGLLGQHDVDNVSGNHANGEEHYQRDQQQRWYDQEKSLDNIVAHIESPSVS